MSDRIRPRSKSPISRRQFLIITGATLATSLLGSEAVAAHMQPESLSRGFWEHLETGTLFADPPELQRAMEVNFGIGFVPVESPSAIAAESKVSEEFIRQTLVLNVSFDGPRLATIASTLEILPKKFYAPLRLLDQESRPLMFSLYDPLTPARSQGRYDAITHRIELAKPYFGQTWPEQLDSKKKLVHELTHSATSGIFDDTPNLAFREPARRLRTILGLRDLKDLRTAFAPTIEGNNEGVITKLKSWTKHIGYGATNFNEFWGVASEFYIDGKDEFVGNYEPYLGQEKSEKFYDGLKVELFEGREYRRGLLIAA